MNIFTINIENDDGKYVLQCVYEYVNGNYQCEVRDRDDLIIKKVSESSSKKCYKEIAAFLSTVGNIVSVTSSDEHSVDTFILRTYLRIGRSNIILSKNL
ncbi:MAG TPA: hypothetical protein VGB50_00185 [Flavobacterium sp.]|jgi:major membrane immunogen (membrane-anchored lipoprotein)